MLYLIASVGDFETVRMPSAMSGRFSMNCFDSVICMLRARSRNQEYGNNLHLEGLVQMLRGYSFPLYVTGCGEKLEKPLYSFFLLG